MSNTLIVATEAMVESRLRSLGCSCGAHTGTAMKCRTPDGATFFFPLALGLGYTQAQLDVVEQCLAACGIDLFPLDPNL